MNLRNLFKSKSELKNNTGLSPLEAALKSAGIAATLAGIASTLIPALGLTTGLVVCSGIVAAVGTASLLAWYLAKRDKMKKTLMMNHLTPKGKPLACGVNADKALLLVNSKNQQKGI